MAFSFKKYLPYSFVILLFFVGINSTDAAQFTIEKSIHLSGTEGWDYLSIDSAARRLYIPRFSHVLVLDADSLKQVGEMPGTNGVHGIALAPKLNRAFTSNGRANTVSVVSLDSLKLVTEVKVGEGPDAILFDDKSERVFVFNGHSKSITVIDAIKAVAIATIELPGRPEFAVSDGSGMLFFNLEDKNSLVSFDTAQLKINNIYKIDPCESPSGLAIDKKNRRLFSVCENKLMAITNADNGKVIATLPIGAGADAASFDTKNALVFSSNGRDGTLSIVKEVSPNKFVLIQTLSTAMGSRTHVFDDKTHRIFLVAGKYGPKPKPSVESPHPRAPIIDGSVECLVVKAN